MPETTVSMKMFLSETERDSPMPRSSQMFRRPDDNMSETESELKPALDKHANSTENSSLFKGRKALQIRTKR